MSRHLFFTATILAFVLMLTACGGGGGSGGGTAGTAPKVALKTSQLLPPGQVYGALQLVLSVPLGVTVPLDPETGKPSPQVVQLVGAKDATKTFTLVTYTPATATAPGKLKFQIYDAHGFVSSGEYIDLQLQVTAGFFPKSTDFTLTDFIVFDLNGNATELTAPSFSVEIT